MLNLTLECPTVICGVRMTLLVDQALLGGVACICGKDVWRNVEKTTVVGWGREGGRVK